MKYNAVEHPVVIQFKGSDPERLSKAAALASSLGYDAVNINCGCPARKCKGEEPSGAILMKDPKQVQETVKAMVGAASVPVTVKCRTGVDDLDSYEYLKNFVETVGEGGTSHFVVHARKALLQGLDPEGNRCVPPLKYEWVCRLAKEFPALQIDLNGGLQSIEMVRGV